ncbi:hypothetical protein QT971_04445 [Microcoleus sp. herbarium19]
MPGAYNESIPQIDRATPATGALNEQDPIASTGKSLKRKSQFAGEA